MWDTVVIQTHVIFKELMIKCERSSLRMTHIQMTGVFFSTRATHLHHRKLKLTWALFSQFPQGRYIINTILDEYDGWLRLHEETRIKRQIKCRRPHIRLQTLYILDWSFENSQIALKHRSNIIRQVFYSISTDEREKTRSKKTSCKIIEIILARDAIMSWATIGSEGMNSEWTESSVGEVLISKAFIQDDWEDSNTMK